MKYVKKKKNRKANGRKFFYVAFIMIMMYLSGYFISFFTQKKIDSTIIEYAESNNAQIFTATIIRNEKLYTAKKSGSLYLNLHNCDVAKKNSVVCSIHDKNSIDKLENDLSQINNNILSMQKNRIDISLFQTDIKNANAQIEKIIDENIYACPQNDFNKINSFCDSVKKNLDLRNQILLTENHGNVKEMNEKKSQIENQIKKNIENITANQTGIVSYFIDGLEKTFTPDNLNNLSPEQLNIQSQCTEIVNNIPVKKNDPVFKIIESNEWYIACYIKNKNIESLKENDLITIFVQNNNDFIPIDVYVHKISARNKNESYLVLKCTKSIHDYLQSRNLKFKLQNTNSQGFKIPVSAIEKKNLFMIPAQFVTKNTNGYSVTKNNESVEIKIYDSDENYYYAESDALKLKDTITSNGKSYQLPQIKKIRGIYIANTGIAEFKKINYEDEIPSAGFIIISPQLNPYIKIYDRIITNVEQVNDGQKIIER